MLRVENLRKSYQVGKNSYEVLKGVSLQVGRGEFEIGRASCMERVLAGV